MQYGTIPGIKKRVSRMIQGGAYTSDEELDKVYALFDKVFAEGCNAIDTGHGYGFGASERAIGLWMETRGVREEVVILDKGAHPYEGRNRVTPEDIGSDIRDSLERLRTDYIDLYVLHRDDPTQPVGPIVEALNEHHAAGRIHAFGGSNWTHQRIAEANEYAAAHGLVPFTISSPQFSLAEMVKPAWDGCVGIGGAQGEAARAWYAAQKMPIFAWSSLALGFMAGRYNPDDPKGFLKDLHETALHAYDYPVNYRYLERSTQLADRKGVEPAQIAFAYVLNYPLDIYALVGNRTQQEFEMNLGAMEIKLTEAEMAWLRLERDDLPE